MLVNAPLSLETAKEVHEWSDEISDRVMNDLLKAVLARVKKVDRDHDIPYAAGYSQNGETIFIDRHMPKSFVHDGKRVQTDRFLILHETVEKALLDEFGLHDLHARRIALHAERAAVGAAGLSWSRCNAFTQENVEKIQDERLTDVPSDLDLMPYRDEKDFEKLKQLAAAETPKG